MISLVTPRLVLRPWTSEDLDCYVHMATDPEVMGFIGDGKPLTAETATTKFKPFLKSWDTHGFGPLAVERLDGTDGEPIGFAGLGIPDFLPDILPAVELGWRLKRDAWGHGFATEASTSILEWAFSSLGLERVVSVIHLDNHRSRRVAQKLEMTLERRTVVPQAQAWVEVYEKRA